METDQVIIRAIEKEHFAEWIILWNANNQGKCESSITSETWRRLLDHGSPVNGLGAWIEGKMAGICHYIIHPTTGSIEPVCYMQDLFVDPAFRRRGIAKSLLKELEAEGCRYKWKRIYWLAEAKNEAARKLYENIGLRLDFTFHVLPLS